ncbi:MAG: HAMP domain-containing sensor histidine kinase [Peptoniphilus sp.]|nr:HAMP domain-containing sensor histidine kinase [Peptoniphilus sp.]
MGKSKDIRYNTKLIWMTIFLISLLATLITTFTIKNKEMTNSSNRPSSIQKEFYPLINNSLYRENVNVAIRQEFDYYVRSYKIKNYPFTQEYKDRYPNITVAMGDNGDYIYGDGFPEDMKTNKDITEEPVFTINYISNRILNEDFDPQEINLNKEDIYVKGFFDADTGNITITKKNIPDEKSVNTKKLYDYLMVGLKNVYGDIDSSQNGIKRINFAYAFNPNADFVSRSIYRDDYLYNAFGVMMMSIVVALFIVAILAIIGNYDRAKEVSFYMGISRYPVEVVLLATGLLAAAVSVLGSTGLVDNFYKYLNIILPTSNFIAIFTASIAVYYFIHGIKSLYNEGLNSFVIEKSIIAKIFKFIKRTIGNFVLNIFSREKTGLDATSYTKYIIIYAALIVLGFIACNTVVNYYGEVVFMLWFMLITSIFAYFRKHIISLKEIESVTDNIAKGNYSVKVDQQNNKFAKITDNVNNISNNLNTAVEKAVKSERMKTELITNVSHDLKTPLTSILNYSELINFEKTKDEDIKEYAEIINEKAHKLKNIIEDLFEISKASSNNIELHLENLDFKSLISQVIGEWEDKLEERGLDIVINFPEKPVMKELDGNKTSRVLDNLFSNINKYALENTRVYVDLIEDERARLTIKNISKYSLNISSDELLERFTRGDSSRNTQGSGLGLSIASSLVEVQGGEFKLDIDGDLFKTIIEF